MPPTQSPAGEDFAESTVRTVTLRLMPLLGLLYLIAYIDRQNVSYAKLDMVGSLGLSETAYGLGASLFFLGYFLFEVPANVFLERVGARVWFARIMFTWGIVTLLLGFTQNAAMFYVLRFLLGAAEAGFFPGVLFALTLWFPQEHRARMIGWFMIASAVANAVGAAIGGALLGLDGVLGLAGWQWVFLATGAPAIVMTAIVLLVLPNGPETAPWLSQDQRDWLARTLRAEREGGGLVDHGNPFAALLDKRVLMLAGVYVSLPLAAYGLGYWLPTVVKGFGVSNLTNGFLNIIPWVATAVALWWVPPPRRPHERPGQRPDLARGRAGAGRGDRAGVERHPAGQRREVRVPVRGGGRDVLGPAGILVDARDLPARGDRGGRDRGDQLGRQPRRLRRAEHGPVHPRPDQERPRADAVPVRLPGDRRRGDVRGALRPAAGCGQARGGDDEAPRRLNIGRHRALSFIVPLNPAR